MGLFREWYCKQPDIREGFFPKRFPLISKWLEKPGIPGKDHLRDRPSKGEASYYNFLFDMAEELERLGTPGEEVKSSFAFRDLSGSYGPLVKVIPRAKGLERLLPRTFSFDKGKEAAAWIDEILCLATPLEERILDHGSPPVFAPSR